MLNLIELVAKANKENKKRQGQNSEFDNLIKEIKKRKLENKLLNELEELDMGNSGFNFDNDDFDYIVENFFTDKNDMIPIMKEILNKNENKDEKGETETNQIEYDKKTITKRIKTILNFIDDREGAYEIKDKENRKILIFMENDGFTMVVNINGIELEMPTPEQIVEILVQQGLLKDFIERLEYNKKKEKGDIKKLLNL